MKFLCIECDTPMKLQETRGPDDGSMSVIFNCPACRKGIAMLTNQMETQMVRSLGVQIGGRKKETQPMEMLRKSLSSKRKDVLPDEPAPEQVAEKESGCPFTGMVAEAYEKNQPAPEAVRWTAEAEKRAQNIPEFIRPMARKSIEQYAREKGYLQIDDSVMDEVKDRYGM